MEKGAPQSDSKHSATTNSSQMDSKSFSISTLPEANACRSSTDDESENENENENEINLQSFSSLIHSLFSDEDMNLLRSPSASTSPPSVDTSVTSATAYHNAVATENRLYQARLIIEYHLYQELLNRYGEALNRLGELTRLVETLSEENVVLRLANADLNHRFNSLWSHIQSSLRNNHGALFSSSSSSAAASPLSLINDLHRISIGRETNIHDIIAKDGFSNVNSPTSVIEPDCMERGGYLMKEMNFLPRSISVRSSGYVKIKHAAAGPSVSSSSRADPNQLVDATRVYVNMEEDAVQMEVCNQGMYKTELCNKWQETGACAYGQLCQFAHGLSELRPVLRHPRYKTEVCRMLLSGINCPYGHRCHFRHSLSHSEKMMMNSP